MTITFVNYFTDGYIWEDLFYMLNHNRVGKIKKKKYASTHRELEFATADGAWRKGMIDCCFSDFADRFSHLFYTC